MFQGPKKGDRNVELNVVPFIDLMSCLTAFLLVTAVWSSHSQLLNQTELGEGGTEDPGGAEAAVLVTDSAVWLGTTTGYQARIDRQTAGHDWPELARSLEDLPETVGRVRVAGTDDVVFQDLITALDTAKHSKIARAAVTEPDALPVRFLE